MKIFKLLVLYIFCSCTIIFSQNFQELQKIQSEYKKALERQALQKPDEISEAEKIAKSTALPDKLIYSRKDIESLLVNTEKLLQQLKFLEDSTKKMPYIGYDFFSRRDTIPFWQNLPLSNNYKLGPGDEVIISLWGESSSFSTEVINRDGQIYIDKIGVLNLGGKSVSEAKNHVISKFSRVYSTLLGEFPKSFIDLTIGELKSINVHFIGFVNIPGVHIVHPFSNVITGLIQAGGVDIKGSLRDVRVIRNDKIIASIDIYNYIISGKSLADVRLMDQDIVYLPPRKSTVPISGRVLRPGYFELLKNETIDNLLNFAGGIDTKSSNKIFLYKDGLSSGSSFIINIKDASRHTLLNGDSLYLPMKPKMESYVHIQGQIKNPGLYPYNSKTDIETIFDATMSLHDKDFRETINLSSIRIFRKNPSGEKPLEIITKFKDNITLKNGDHITVARKNVKQPIESVKITGEIKTPGVYPVNGLTSLSKILDLSGGLTKNALEDGIEIFRDSSKIGWHTDSFILKSGDSLNVLKKTGLVFIGGEVNVPGYLSFKKNDSVKKYISRAGGFTSFANQNNIYVKYPNGSSSSISGIFSPKVKEGSLIYVNQRSIAGKSESTGWQVFSEIFSQTGSIATTLLTLSILSNQQNNGN
tara:strand:- start:715 stop:2643 length:1929 start_codon:yes stop_codon:yes gene_type:complete